MMYLASSCLIDSYARRLVRVGFWMVPQDDRSRSQRFRWVLGAAFRTICVRVRSRAQRFEPSRVRTLLYVCMHPHPWFEPTESSNISIMWGARLPKPRVLGVDNLRGPDRVSGRSSRSCPISPATVAPTLTQHAVPDLERRSASTAPSD